MLVPLSVCAEQGVVRKKTVWASPFQLNFVSCFYVIKHCLFLSYIYENSITDVTLAATLRSDHNIVFKYQSLSDKP